MLREPTHELKRPLHHSVGLRNLCQRAEVLARSGFETELAQAGAVVAGRGRNEPEPFVGVVDLDCVQPVIAEAVEERRFVIHQPNDEATARSDAGIDDRVLDVLWFAGFVGEDEVDFRMGLGAGVDFAGAGREVIALWGGVSADRCKFGGTH